MAYGASEKLILSENTRWSYVSIWEPKSINGEEPKFSITLIIKKGSPDMEVIGNTIKEVYRNNSSILTGTDGTLPPLNTLKTPVRDGDVDKADDPDFAGCYYINAYSKFKPGIVDEDLNTITDRNQVYSGCYGRASISFYAYNNGESCGIGCSLNHLQKVRDGEKMGSTAVSSAAEEFKAFAKTPSKSTNVSISADDTLPF